MFASDKPVYPCDQEPEKQAEQRSAQNVGRIVDAQIHARVAENRRPKRKNPPCVPCDAPEETNQQHDTSEAVGGMGGGKTVMAAAVFGAVGESVHMHLLMQLHIVGGTRTLYKALYHHRSAVGTEYADAEAEHYPPGLSAIVPE